MSHVSHVWKQMWQQMWQWVKQQDMVVGMTAGVAAGVAASVAAGMTAGLALGMSGHGGRYDSRGASGCGGGCGWLHPRGEATRSGHNCKHILSAEFLDLNQHSSSGTAQQHHSCTISTPLHHQLPHQHHTTVTFASIASRSVRSISP